MRQASSRYHQRAFALQSTGHSEVPLNGASLGCNSWLAKAAQGGYRGTGHEAGSVCWAPTAKGSSSATSACWGTEPLGPLDGAGESTLRGFVEGLGSKACSSESSNDATEVCESGDSDLACGAPNHANATKSRTSLPAWRHLNGRAQRAPLATRILYNAPRGDKPFIVLRQ
jgi:hypothetical protein